MTNIERLIRGSSAAGTASTVTRKETVSDLIAQQTDDPRGRQEAGSPPTYADGVRAVLSILDKHREGIEKALAYGRNSHDYDHICEKVIKGELIFIPLPKSIMLCEVSRTPNFKAFHCFIATGDLDELLTVGTAQLGDAAKAYGCKYISIAGRRGWEPHLKKQGWTSPLTVLYKEVTDG